MSKENEPDMSLDFSSVDMDRLVAGISAETRALSTYDGQKLPRIRRAPASQSDHTPAPGTRRHEEPLPDIEPFDLDEVDQMLDELDLSAYPKVQAGGSGDSVTFCERFLPAVLDDYTRTGKGIYECILVFPHNRVTDEIVRSFNHSITARISRLRAQRPNITPFRVVFDAYEILPDRMHVLSRVIRITEALYPELKREQRARRPNAVDADKKLAQYL